MFRRPALLLLLLSFSLAAALRPVARRAAVPWRLQLEDVHPFQSVKMLSNCIYDTLNMALEPTGVVIAQTRSDFVIVAAPASCHTHGLSVLESVIAYLAPLPRVELALVDAVELFTVGRGIFRCCDGDLPGTTAHAARINGTPVWMLFSEDCPALQNNECVSGISRSQFAELQGAFSIMLDLELAD